MQQRRLGRDGPLVSAIGLGALSFSNFYVPVDAADIDAVLSTAIDLGITHIDTSNVYGMGASERGIGEFLARQGKSGQDFFTLATKAGITRDASGKRTFDNSRAHLEAELDASLVRLHREAVDLFYVHRYDNRLSIEEVTGILVDLVRAGKIRHFGFSEIAPSTLRRAAAVHPVAAVQSEYSLATRMVELGMVQACAELGTSLVAFSPLSRGLLTDVVLDEGRISQSSFLREIPRYQEPNLSANLSRGAMFREIAQQYGTTAAALAIAWLLSRGEHIIPIPGTHNPAHLRDLAAGAELRLDPAIIEIINAALPPGWIHGDRYSAEQWVGVERYC